VKVRDCVVLTAEHGEQEANLVFSAGRRGLRLRRYRQGMERALLIPTPDQLFSPGRQS
jgi:hypothetical protein